MTFEKVTKQNKNIPRKVTIAELPGTHFRLVSCMPVDLFLRNPHGFPKTVYDITNL